MKSAPDHASIRAIGEYSWALAGSSYRLRESKDNFAAIASWDDLPSAQIQIRQRMWHFYRKRRCSYQDFVRRPKTSDTCVRRTISCLMISPFFKGAM